MIRSSGAAPTPLSAGLSPRTLAPEGSRGQSLAGGGSCKPGTARTGSQANYTIRRARALDSLRVRWSHADPGGFVRISRVEIQNFRNFETAVFELHEHAVIVGENKAGKSNLLHALRLVLDPSLPDPARRLRQEDFWDGLPRPLTRDHRISISVDLADFEDSQNLLAVLADHLVAPTPMVARLTYVWQPKADLDRDPRGDADYEFMVYGGDRPENKVGYEVRRRLPMDLLPAAARLRGRSRAMDTIAPATAPRQGGRTDRPGDPRRSREGH